MKTFILTLVIIASIATSVTSFSKSVIESAMVKQESAMVLIDN